LETDSAAATSSTARPAPACSTGEVLGSNIRSSAELWLAAASPRTARAPDTFHQQHRGRDGEDEKPDHSDAAVRRLVDVTLAALRP
jgi:hypothetical protein